MFPGDCSAELRTHFRRSACGAVWTQSKEHGGATNAVRIAYGGAPGRERERADVQSNGHQEGHRPWQLSALGQERRHSVAGGPTSSSPSASQHVYGIVV